MVQKQSVDRSLELLNNKMFLVRMLLDTIVLLIIDLKDIVEVLMKHQLLQFKARHKAVVIVGI